MSTFVYFVITFQVGKMNPHKMCLFFLIITNELEAVPTVIMNIKTLACVSTHETWSFTSYFCDISREKIISYISGKNPRLGAENAKRSFLINFFQEIVFWCFLQYVRQKNEEFLRKLRFLNRFQPDMHRYWSHQLGLRSI